MNHRFHTRRLPTLWSLVTILYLSLLAVGCGDSEDYVFSNSVSPSTATIRLQTVLARTVPAAVTDYRLTGLSSGGDILYGPVVQAKAGTVNFTGVSTQVTSVFLELLENGTVVGSGTFPVSLTPEEVFVLADPNFSVVDTRFLASLSPQGSLSFHAINDADGSLTDIPSPVTTTTGILDFALSPSNDVLYTLSGNGLLRTYRTSVESRTSLVTQSFPLVGEVTVGTGCDDASLLVDPTGRFVIALTFTQETVYPNFRFHDGAQGRYAFHIFLVNPNDGSLQEGPNSPFTRPNWVMNARPQGFDQEGHFYFVERVKKEFSITPLMFVSGLALDAATGRFTELGSHYADISGPYHRSFTANLVPLASTFVIDIQGDRLYWQGNHKANALSPEFTQPSYVFQIEEDGGLSQVDGSPILPDLSAARYAGPGVIFPSGSFGIIMQSSFLSLFALNPETGIPTFVRDLPTSFSFYRGDSESGGYARVIRFIAPGLVLLTSRTRSH
ncbi:MAG: hypothetical protein WC314_07820 [Vulcanimicrobiota bacterium]